MVACSVQKNYKTLSFFFDGVPEPVNDSLMVQVDTTLNDSLSADMLLALNSVPEVYYHAPYQEKLCSDCHDSQVMGKLTTEQPELCYQCHTDYSTDYKTLHGPVEGGSCTECHDPHQSKINKLLRSEGESLCFTCHDEEGTLENTMHNIVDEKNCITCHNPHGGENQFVLQKGTCYKCHDDFKNQYKVLHGPIAGGFCMECHTSHIEGTNNLKRQGQDLCFYCHDKNETLRNENHTDIGDSNCTECHNPHGGEDRFLFY